MKKKKKRIHYPSKRIPGDLDDSDYSRPRRGSGGGSGGGDGDDDGNDDVAPVVRGDGSDMWTVTG